MPITWVSKKIFYKKYNQTNNRITRRNNSRELHSSSSSKDKQFTYSWSTLSVSIRASTFNLSCISRKYFTLQSEPKPEPIHSSTLLIETLLCNLLLVKVLKQKHVSVYFFYTLLATVWIRGAQWADLEDLLGLEQNDNRQQPNWHE